MNVSDKYKQQAVARLKARLEDLAKKRQKILEAQLDVCEHLSEFMGREEFLRWLKEQGETELLKGMVDEDEDEDDDEDEPNFLES